MSFGLRPSGVAPYGLINTPAQSYTLTAGTGSFALTGNDANFGLSMPADTGAFTLTGNDATLTYTAPVATGGGLPAKRKRRARGDAPGNRDFLGSLRNSRPGIAEEEMREVLATVKARMPMPLDDGEDEDEEAILWLL